MFLDMVELRMFSSMIVVDVQVLSERMVDDVDSIQRKGMRSQAT
jgi:hypothetical protein